MPRLVANETKTEKLKHLVKQAKKLELSIKSIEGDSIDFQQNLFLTELEEAIKEIKQSITIKEKIYMEMFTSLQRRTGSGQAMKRPSRRLDHIIPRYIHVSVLLGRQLYSTIRKLEDKASEYQSEPFMLNRINLVQMRLLKSYKKLGKAVYDQMEAYDIYYMNIKHMRAETFQLDDYLHLTDGTSHREFIKEQHAICYTRYLELRTLYSTTNTSNFSLTRSVMSFFSRSRRPHSIDSIDSTAQIESAAMEHSDKTTTKATVTVIDLDEVMSQGETNNNDGTGEPKSSFFSTIV